MKIKLWGVNRQSYQLIEIICGLIFGKEKKLQKIRQYFSPVFKKSET